MTAFFICLSLIQDGQTPLHFAAKFKKPAVIDVLLRNKADADCRNKVWKVISRQCMSYP